jgi:hypothetical protein
VKRNTPVCGKFSLENKNNIFNKIGGFVKKNCGNVPGNIHLKLYRIIA